MVTDIVDSLIFCANNTLILSFVFLNSMNDVALNILTHVFMSFSNGSWWTCPSASLLFHLIDSFLVVTIVCSSAALVRYFNMCAKTTIVANTLLIALDLSIINIKI